MKIAVFGGSFNPFHSGHAMLADTIIKELNYDKVLFVPAFLPPHKMMSNMIDPVHRLEMLKIFCKETDPVHFEAESCEIDRGGVSYTVDTLEYLTQKYKTELSSGNKLSLIMGDEVAAEFHKWYKTERIVQLADFIITHRYPSIEAIENTLFNNKPSGDYKGDFKEKFDEKAFGYPCVYLKNPVLPVSSTEVREKIAKNGSYRFLIPDCIYKYIEKNNLYKLEK